MKVLYKANKTGSSKEIIGTLEEISKATTTRPEVIAHRAKTEKSVNKYAAWQFQVVDPVKQWQLELLELYGNTVLNAQTIELFGKEQIEQACLDNGIDAKVNAVEDALGTTYLLETEEAETRRLARWKT